MTSSTPITPDRNALIPRESLSESGKWMYITDNSLKLMSLGLLCGGGVSMILFRSIVMRAVGTAYGAGFGIGKSYVDSKYILGHNVPAEFAWTAQVTPLKKDHDQESIQ